MTCLCVKRMAVLLWRIPTQVLSLSGLLHYAKVQGMWSDGIVISDKDASALLRIVPPFTLRTHSLSPRSCMHAIALCFSRSS